MLLDARDYSSSSLSDVEPHILDHLNTQNAELEKKLAEMHVSLGGAHLGETCEEQDAPGYGCTSQGACAHRMPICCCKILFCKLTLLDVFIC